MWDSVCRPALKALLFAPFRRDEPQRPPLRRRGRRRGRRRRRRCR